MSPACTCQFPCLSLSLYLLFFMPLFFLYTNPSAKGHSPANSYLLLTKLSATSLDDHTVRGWLPAHFLLLCICVFTQVDISVNTRVQIIHVVHQSTFVKKMCCSVRFNLNARLSSHSSACCPLTRQVSQNCPWIWLVTRFMGDEHRSQIV